MTPPKPSKKPKRTRTSKPRTQLTTEQCKFWRSSLAAGVPLSLIVREQRRIDSYIAAWKAEIIRIMEKRAESQPGRTKRERMRSLNRVLATERRDFERWVKHGD